ncbi:hypothetical protein ISN44_As12g036130 [Arabidopsis suecica]|uniref:Uncharacterized protein n=1 Tax=Arabidopsis suecica TaxID=45249 RepID=A0A8T1YQ83_ARASU|nr:hypothetical protein ISN44_As12g036130 [Arabidopsis suecica]
MATTSSKAISFFGIIQRTYCFFSSSIKRWKIFEDHVDGLTLKPLSHTRWESHVESVKAIRFQAPKIMNALVYIAENSDDPKEQSDAECLATSETHGIGSFEFLVSMVIWYNLLSVVNIVSKSLQSEDMNIDVAISQLKGLVSYFQKYRESGFEKAKTEAKEIAESLEIDPVFPKKAKRVIKRKRHYGEESENMEGSVTLSPEESFRVDYFIQIMDQALYSLETRFEQFQRYEQIFGFLFDLRKLQSASDDSLMASCVNLEVSLTHGKQSDVVGHDLFFELKVLREALPKEVKRPIEIYPLYNVAPSLYCRFVGIVMSFHGEGLFPVLSFAAGGFSGYQPVIVLLPKGMEVSLGYLILAEDEEIVKLVIERIIPACLMETKKKSHTQWVTSRGQDHDNLERLSLILNKSTSGLWLHPLRYCWIVIWRLHVNVIKYWLDSFNKPWEDKEESVMMAGIYDRLIVVATNKSIMSTFQNYFRKHRVLSCGVHYGGSAKRCYSRTHFALEEDQKW